VKDTCGLWLGLTLTAEAPTASLPSAIMKRDEKIS
jgi:hypothetical protein